MNTLQTINTSPDHAMILREIEALSDLTVSQLHEKWAQVWGEACRSRNKEFLRKRIAWKIQANAYGGLSQRALERARELADETLLKVRGAATPGPLPVVANTRPEIRTKAGKSKADSRLPGPGSILTRTFEGRKIVVTVLEGAFEWEGQQFKSLSAAAKAITGTSWNGFAFFGLDGKRKENAE
jgi:hypothetical protein